MLWECDNPFVRHDTWGEGERRWTEISEKEPLCNTHARGSSWTPCRHKSRGSGGRRTRGGARTPCPERGRKVEANLFWGPTSLQSVIPATCTFCTFLGELFDMTMIRVIWTFEAKFSPLSEDVAKLVSDRDITYPVVDYWLEGVLELLEDPVTLQDVDNPEEQEQSLALVVSSWNAAGPEIKWRNIVKTQKQKYAL